MVPLFKETNFALVGNLGRPRHAVLIGVGLAETASHLHALGTKVVALEADPDLLDRATDLASEAHLVDLASPNPFAILADRRFDLIAVEGAQLIADLPRFFARAAEHLVDGGHVVVCSQSGRLEVREALEQAGLDVLRYDLNPRVFRSKLPSGATKAVDDLRITHTVSFRATYALLRPLERLIALGQPDLLAAEHINVARVPPKPGPLSLTIGMLTLNEQESVERMIDEIRSVAPDASILLIDSSSDRTPELAKAKGARVIRQLPPQGHGPAMERLMYEAALQTEALIYIDCDFTYPTQTIPRLRAILEEGVDVVNASRTSRKPEAMPLPNYVANRTFAAMSHLAHGVPTTDVHSGMRAYRSSVIRAFAFDGSGDALPVDTLLLPARSRYRVVEFPIDYHERMGVSKLAKFRGTLWTLLRVAGAFGHGDRVGRNSRFERRER